MDEEAVRAIAKEHGAYMFMHAHGQYTLGVGPTGHVIRLVSKRETRDKMTTLWASDLYPNDIATVSAASGPNGCFYDLDCEWKLMPSGTP